MLAIDRVWQVGLKLTEGFSGGYLPARHLLNELGQPVPFHVGQEWIYDADTRFVIMAAGSQGGKTSFAPVWMAREIYGEGVFGENRARVLTAPGRGRGDYLAVAPTYDLFKLKMLPSMLAIFEDKLGLGRYWPGGNIIELADPETGAFLGKRVSDPKMWGRIILRSANAEGGLESSTANAAWLDEAGQSGFAISEWRAVLRRVALKLGRVLITTTLYDFGWIEQEFIDPLAEHGTKQVETSERGEAERTVERERDVTLVQFDSVINPEYPMQEYRRAEATMPADEFARQYRGRAVKSRFLIYDVFDWKHVIPDFELPADWPHYIGLDFGGVHTAAVKFAENPKTKDLYLFMEYLEGGRTAKEHAAALASGERAVPFTVGGAKSEGQWRLEFASGGLPVYAPVIVDVNVGIQRVYAQLKLRKLFIFESCTGTIAQIGKYHRKRDKAGNITDEIDDKAIFHYLDAIRYIVGMIRDDSSWSMGMAK